MHKYLESFCHPGGIIFLLLCKISFYIVIIFHTLNSTLSDSIMVILAFLKYLNICIIYHFWSFNYQFTHMFEFEMILLSCFVSNNHYILIGVTKQFKIKLLICICAMSAILLFIFCVLLLLLVSHLSFLNLEMPFWINYSGFGFISLYNYGSCHCSGYEYTYTCDYNHIHWTTLNKVQKFKVHLGPFTLLIYLFAWASEGTIFFCFSY